jgi:hypothetical protein
MPACRPRRARAICSFSSGWRSRKSSWWDHDAPRRRLRQHGRMARGSRRVVIELDATDGPPQGRISVDGMQQRAFHGWIDLTACLESLRHPPGTPAGATGNVDGSDTRGPRQLPPRRSS